MVTQPDKQEPKTRRQKNLKIFFLVFTLDHTKTLRQTEVEGKATRRNQLQLNTIDTIKENLQDLLRSPLGEQQRIGTSEKQQRKLFQLQKKGFSESISPKELTLSNIITFITHKNYRKDI